MYLISYRMKKAYYYVPSHRTGAQLVERLLRTKSAVYSWKETVLNKQCLEVATINRNKVDADNDNIAELYGVH